MQVCRKEQGERKETFKDGGKRDEYLQKFAEDGGNVCEGQEQNSSCFRSIAELDQFFCSLPN